MIINTEWGALGIYIYRSELQLFRTVEYLNDSRIIRELF